MNTRGLLTLMTLVITSLSTNLTLFGQLSDRADGMRFLPDVPGQFRALTERGDPLGIRRGASPNPNPCRHYQAIERAAGSDGTPYFFMTRSGNMPPSVPFDFLCFGSDGDKFNGTLIVFRMGSAEKNGERLGGNRFQSGVHTNDTMPPNEDTSPIYYTVVGGDPNDPDPSRHPGLVPWDGANGAPERGFQHPGGMQRIGRILAVAAESRRDPLSECEEVCQLLPLESQRDACVQACRTNITYERAPDPTQIAFFDITDPESPVFKSKFAPYRIVNEQRVPLQGADGLGVTALRNGRYLMSVTGGFEVGDKIYFYRSTLANSDTSPNVLERKDLDWELVGQDNGPTNIDDVHQTLQFLREGSIDGALYLAGARGLYEGHPFYDESHERVDLYQLTSATPDFEPGGWINLVERYHGQRITPFPNSGGQRLGNLAAASGFYVSPSGELLFYSSQHDNQGPNATATLGEWRHKNVVREGSPTLLPTATIAGPAEIDEGSAVNFTGTAEPPITKAFIQLFHDQDLKSFNPLFEYKNRNRDDFDDLFLFELQLNVLPPFFHADQAESWNWYAPKGCTIEAVDRDNNGVVNEVRSLTNAVSASTGEPEIQISTSLTDVMNDAGTDDVNLEIDKISFKSDCEAYYSGPFRLSWDLDLNGSFETTGSQVTLNAAYIDGPSVINVPAEARHTNGGLSGSAKQQVTIRNVSPQIQAIGLADSGGNEIGTQAPFVLTGQPFSLRAGFTDPGLLDSQTASINWGDGTTDLNGAFGAFDLASGDGVGALAHSHRYPSSGTYGISIRVTDDDGGTDLEVISLRVLTPEQAVAEIIAMLDAAIATCPNTSACSSLSHARGALAGYNPNSNSGALKKIQAGDRPSAKAFLQTAGTWLGRAEADGATNVGGLRALLLQVSSALAN